MRRERASEQERARARADFARGINYGEAPRSQSCTFLRTRRDATRHDTTRLDFGVLASLRKLDRVKFRRHFSRRSSRKLARNHYRYLGKFWSSQFRCASMRFPFRTTRARTEQLFHRQTYLTAIFRKREGKRGAVLDFNNRVFALENGETFERKRKRETCRVFSRYAKVGRCPRELLKDSLFSMMFFLPFPDAVVAAVDDDHDDDNGNVHTDDVTYT